jgi:hypothetical protein
MMWNKLYPDLKAEQSITGFFIPIPVVEQFLFLTGLRHPGKIAKQKIAL